MSDLTKRNLKMASLRSSGLTLTQIGDRYGLTRERVRQITGRPTPIKDTPRNAAMIARRRQGLTCAEIAIEFGVSRPCVEHICRDVPRAEVWRVRKSEARTATMRRELARAVKALEGAWLLARGDDDLETDLSNLLEAACELFDLMKEKT